jgi:hypothetical protein
MTDASPANIEALHEQRDWLLVTLSSFGDAVIHHRHQRRRYLPEPGGSVLDRLDARGRSRNTAGHRVRLRPSTMHRDAVNPVADLRIPGAGRGCNANPYV